MRRWGSARWFCYWSCLGLFMWLQSDGGRGWNTQNGFTYMSPFLTGTAARLGSAELLGKLDLSIKYQGLSFSMWSLQARS